MNPSLDTLPPSRFFCTLNWWVRILWLKEKPISRQSWHLYIGRQRKKGIWDWESYSCTEVVNVSDVEASLRHFTPFSRSETRRRPHFGLVLSTAWPTHSLVQGIYLQEREGEHILHLTDSHISLYFFLGYKYTIRICKTRQRRKRLRRWPQVARTMSVSPCSAGCSGVPCPDFCRFPPLRDTRLESIGLEGWPQSCFDENDCLFG